MKRGLKWYNNKSFPLAFNVLNETTIIYLIKVIRKKLTDKLKLNVKVKILLLSLVYEY